LEVEKPAFSPDRTCMRGTNSTRRSNLTGMPIQQRSRTFTGDTLYFSSLRSSRKRSYAHLAAASAQRAQHPL